MYISCYILVWVSNELLKLIFELANQPLRYLDQENSIYKKNICSFSLNLGMFCDIRSRFAEKRLVLSFVGSLAFAGQCREWHSVVTSPVCRTHSLLFTLGLRSRRELVPTSGNQFPRWIITADNINTFGGMFLAGQ